MMFSVKKFRLLLIENCMTAKAFSAACGVSETAICQILNHGRKPKMATIGKFAKALNVAASELLTDD